MLSSYRESLTMELGQEREGLTTVPWKVHHPGTVTVNQPRSKESLYVSKGSSDVTA